MVTKTIEQKTLLEREEMNYEEYLNSASESRIMEWVQGEVITYMPPTYEHQNIVSFLSQLLGSFIEFFNLGKMILAPFEVKLWPDGPSREPDILFARKGNLSQLTTKRFVGGPDLVVEVVSPGSITEDRVHKFTEYEQAGVREYWLIDPRPRQQQVDVYVLDDNGRFQPAPIDEDGRFHSIVLPHFWLDLAWFTQDELPNPQLALAAIMLTIDELPAQARATFQSLHELLAERKSQS